MKSLNIKILIIFAFSFFAVACEENFSPKTETKDGFFLYSILTADDSPYSKKQIAIITKIYDVNNFDPNTNTIDPTIIDATVTLTVGNETYKMILDSVAIDYQNRAKQYLYSVKAKISSYDSLNISAKLSNGKVLVGKTRAPKYLSFDFSYPYNHGFTTNLNQVIPVYSWTIYWNNYNPTHLLFPQMLIVYTQNVNGTKVNKSIEVPIKMFTRNGIKEPYYVNYISQFQLSYDFEAFDYAMTKLSEGNPNKSDYTILYLDFKIAEFDLPLTNYYSATNGYLDSYSIRTDNNLYSNISGGYGVVGSKFINGFTKEFDKYYVKSFGYNTP